VSSSSPLSRARQALGLAAWLGLAFLTAGVGALASLDAASFYAQLVRPGWAPPAGLFGPVWTALFLAMGVAAWQVWRVSGPAARPALALFTAQLGANALWSWLFFAWHLGALALLDVVLLWLLIAATVRAFWRHSRAAGALLLPYLAWVGFAACLTWAVWRANPHWL